MQNFYRVGQPVRIPVSASSAGAQFEIAFTAEQAATPDLAFMFVNPNSFDVRLEGTPAGGQFVAVTVATGWPILARTVAMGPFTSKKPVMLSAVAWDHPGNPLMQGASYDGCYLELIYGRGA